MTRLFLLAALLALSACIEDKPEVETAAPAPTAMVTVIEGETLTGTRRFVGRLDAVSTVDMTFQVGGEIVDIPVREGTVVGQGEILATLDPEDFELALREAELSRGLAQNEFQRRETLVANNSVSRAAFEQAEAEFRLADLAVENAARNLAHTQIKAPFDALITRRLSDTYSNIQPGTPVLRIQDVSEYRVVISVPEDLIALVETPESFDITARFGMNGHSREVPLTYREHNTEPDAVAQTYQVSFALDPAIAGGLLPGMTASVEVSPKTAIAGSALRVPESALDVAEDGGFRVWLFDPVTNTVSPRDVTVGRVTDAFLPVTDGIASGDTIVTAGVHLLRDGMVVQPMAQQN